MAFVRHSESHHPEVVQPLFPLAIYVPRLYETAHLRYLVLIIPLLLLLLFERRTYSPNTMV